MANELNIFDIGFRAAKSDLSGKRGFCATLQSDGTFDLSGDGELCQGILTNDPLLGEAAAVRNVGISDAVLGGTVSVNDKLASNAAGKLIVAVSGKHPVAVAMSAGVADEFVTVLVMPSLIPLV